MKTSCVRKNQQKGYTMLELMLVLTVISLLVISQIKLSNQSIKDLKMNSLVDQYQRIQRASMRWRSHRGEWPEQTSVLINNGYLNPDEDKDLWGQTYTLRTLGDDLHLSTSFVEQQYIGSVAGRLSRVLIHEGRLTSVIDPPGNEVAHQQLYALNGDRPLTGDLDVDHNDVINVNTLQVRLLALASTSIRQGNSCQTRGLTVDIQGRLMGCINGQWQVYAIQQPQ